MRECAPSMTYVPLRSVRLDMWYTFRLVDISIIACGPPIRKPQHVNAAQRNRSSGSFYSLYDQGFARVAACAVPVALADPETNAATVIAAARECGDQGVAIAVFPELCLTGYAIDDLLLADPLLDAAQAAIETVRAASEDLLPVVVVGAPLATGNRLYNCAVVIHRGSVLGVVPKSYLPNYREFYEKRHFALGAEVGPYSEIEIGDAVVPFGSRLLFEAADVAGLTLHVDCLLYTSDAADDLLCVDLGGRRIIKKK